ncbi:MAG: cellulose binding domain-containing protein [Catenulisporales bacterium]|jgi:endoglucanase|nr:cellulose binding domain-containing protein [Catenulisporales bacterium]
MIFHEVCCPFAQTWNGVESHCGPNETVTNAGYNDSLSPGGSTYFGFQGTGSANRPPTLTCTAG